jgi:type III secretory pathway component EscS
MASAFEKKDNSIVSLVKAVLWVWAVTSGKLCIFGAFVGMFFALISIVSSLHFPWQEC